MSRKRNGLFRREGSIFDFRYKDAAGTWCEKYPGETDREQARLSGGFPHGIMW